MRNLAHIGFEILNLEDFQALAAMVCAKGKSYRAGRNQYYCFTDQSGAELWTQVDENDDISGMNAHFHGNASVEVMLLRAQGYDDRPLDGTFEARPIRVDAGRSKDTVPPTFAFELPDAHLVPSVVLPAEAHVQLVGFAREVHCYENVEDFRKANPNTPLENIQAIEADLATNAGLSSLVRMDGIVLNARKLQNEFSGRSFYHLELKTVVGQVDVVASTRSIPTLPQAGQVFDGTVRLSGRVKLDHSVTQKPGLVERFFWGAHANQRLE